MRSNQESNKSAALFLLVLFYIGILGCIYGFFNYRQTAINKFKCEHATKFCVLEINPCLLPRKVIQIPFKKISDIAACKWCSKRCNTALPKNYYWNTCVWGNDGQPFAVLSPHTSVLPVADPNLVAIKTFFASKTSAKLEVSYTNKCSINGASFVLVGIFLLVLVIVVYLFDIPWRPSLGSRIRTSLHLSKLRLVDFVNAGLIVIFLLVLFGGIIKLFA